MDYPNKIYVKLYRETGRGEVFERLNEHGDYYVCKNEYASPVTSFIRLCSDGHLEYLWNGKHTPLNCEWEEIRKITA